jgi:uncharacterized protein
MVVVVAVGVLVGVALGLLGGGGSILVLPALVYGGGIPERTAIAMSLLVVGAVSGFGALLHARRGNVRWAIAAAFAPPAMVGAFAGGLVAQWIPAPALLLGFAVLMAATAVTMWRGRAAAAGAGAGPREMTVRQGMLVVAEGSVVGFVTGLVGAGGGFLVVPALVLLSGLSMRAAVGTSLVVIALKSFTGFAGHATHVSIDYGLTLIVMGAAALGLVGGMAVARFITQDKLRRVFAGLVAVMAAFMIVQELGRLLP